MAGHFPATRQTNLPSQHVRLPSIQHCWLQIYHVCHGIWQHYQALCEEPVGISTLTVWCASDKNDNVTLFVLQRSALSEFQGRQYLQYHLSVPLGIGSPSSLHIFYQVHAIYRVIPTYCYCCSLIGCLGYTVHEGYNHIALWNVTNGVCKEWFAMSR